ncbi:MAG: hypothetical protein KQA34_02095, partial [Candidatus Aenigmarchaeota archaeon]|nr:hypothetical protein [Candidatus Aenigmarchaeota archaeon]
MNIKSVNILLILFTLIITLFISFSENDYIESKLELNLNRGWNLISIPFEKYKIEYNDCQIRSIFSYENREWKRVNINNLEPGKGYFIRVNNNCKIVISGTIKTDVEKVIKLDRGWNLIGVISPIPVGYILDRYNVSKIYVFENGQWRELKENDLLEPGNGYAIRTTANIELRLEGMLGTYLARTSSIECDVPSEAFVGDKVVIRCICNFYPLGGLEGRLISPSKNGEYSRTYPIYYACRSKFRTYSFSFDANIEGTWRFVINRGISEVVNEYRINVKKPLTQQQCKIECDPIPSEAYIGDKVNITCKCSGCERPIQVYVKPIVTDVIESIFPLGKYTFKIGEGMCSINGTY